MSDRQQAEVKWDLHRPHPGMVFHETLVGEQDTRSPVVVSNFFVLLGPDYVGKTSAMKGLMERLDGKFVSHDDVFLGDDASLIGCLKREFLRRLDMRSILRPSEKFLLSLLQPIVAYMREQVMAAEAGERIIVDGYYYKILSKCRLLGLVDDELFASWRRFPRPALVIYLDTNPETTWQRVGTARLNPFEYYGSEPTRDGFRMFQRDLANALSREVDDVPVCRVAADCEPQCVLDEIEITIREWSAR